MVEEASGIGIRAKGMWEFLFIKKKSLNEN